MEQNQIAVRLGFSVHQHSNHRVTWCLTLSLSLVGAMACGIAEDPSSWTEEELSTRVESLETPGEPGTNGLGVNGLGVNGLGVNGLGVNGLGVNGLGVNGLAAEGFQSWFEADPALRERVMKYVVACAVLEGQSRTYTSAVTGQSYTWAGMFGLAPGWSAGFPATVTEQQVITACLAAHTNKYGLNIPISVLGRDAIGGTISYTPGELATYSEREACFFGNAFNNEGIFAANDRTFLRPAESTPRACGLSSRISSTECPPIAHVGSCKDYCTLDPTKTFYVSCTYNGVTYRPITTRLLPQDIYRCGDGVCQFTESCGTGDTYDNCALDCGACK
jgi:hypothetical protein